MAYSGSVPDTAGRPLDWMAETACQDKEKLSLFGDPKREYEARTECIAHCPVRSQCLGYVKHVEAGATRKERDGVIAGLTHSERWRCDTEVYRARDDTPALVFDGTEPCGTHLALLRHLWLDEPIDAKCWTGTVHRARTSRAPTARPRTAAK